MPALKNIRFLAPFCDPIDPQKFEFSQIPMAMPPILFRQFCHQYFPRSFLSPNPR